MQKKIKDLFGLKMELCFYVNYFKLCGDSAMGKRLEGT